LLWCSRAFLGRAAGFKAFTIPELVNFTTASHALHQGRLRNLEAQGMESTFSFLESKKVVVDCAAFMAFIGAVGVMPFHRLVEVLFGQCFPVRDGEVETYDIVVRAEGADLHLQPNALLPEGTL
jgi:hypothetical protein